MCYLNDSDNEKPVCTTKRKRFTPEEDEIIRQNTKNKREFTWEEIARKIPGRTAKQVCDRYNNYLSKNLKHEKWTKEEDNLIIDMYLKIGPKWTEIATLLDGRNGNNVKNRWYKYLMKESDQIPFDMLKKSSKKQDTLEEYNFNILENEIDLLNLFEHIDLSKNAN